MNNIDNIINYINELPEIKRYKELNHYITNNKNINDKLNEMKKIQKQMVNSKEFNQMNQYIVLKQEYDKIISEINDLPFVEEYLELLDYVNDLLKNIKYKIEKEIDKLIN